jgi:O-antigen biosynthesis protein
MLRRAEKAWLIFKKHGFRGGIREILTLYAGLQGPKNPDWLLELDFLMFPESKACLDAKRDGPITINWFIPDFGRASGGHINIFRFVLLFESFGLDQRIYIVGGMGGSPELILEAARRTYFPITTPFEILSLPLKVRDADVLIATSWETAYWARSIPNVRRKYYMVQDREDLFFAAGAYSEFARATYRFGFKGLAAGNWLAEILKRDYGMQCHSFGFSYDRNLYASEFDRKAESDRPRIFFYARPGTERRGLELGILALSLVAAALPSTQFVFAGMAHQDWNLPFTPEYAGVLRLDQLSEMYGSCDAALVLSLTNLSLLPLELMASGCPVVSNNGPNVEWMLNETNSVLCDPEPQALANGLIELLSNHEKRRQLRQSGLEFVKSTSWELEAQMLMQLFVTDLGILHV